VQEEFAAYHEDLLADDIRAFNDQLLAYLGRYNTERPHQALQYQTPCQAIAKHLPQKSRIGWQRTRVFVGDSTTLRTNAANGKKAMF